MHGSSFKNRHCVFKELLKLNKHNKQAEHYFILFLII